MNNRNAASRFDDLRQASIHFLENRDAAYPHLSSVISTVKTEFERTKLPEPMPEPERLPGCCHLPAALEMAKEEPMADLARAFERFEPYMRWIRTEHYQEKLGDDFMNNYCYTNLFGYDALIPHERIIVAFFVIGPGRHYPRHHHEAEEIYFPFGGDTLWSQADEPFGIRPPAEPIYNTPWLPHEMKTQKTPLFTFCFWISPGPIKLSQLTE